jgi:hypothetical protein
MQLKQLPAGNLAALLQLAMNGSSHATAEAAVGYMPAQLEPASVRRLLLTAALREHDSAVQKIAGSTVVKQHVDTPTVHRTLQELVQRAAPDMWSFWQEHVDQLRNSNELSIEAVCTLPAAAALGSDAVAQLLLIAVQANAGDQCIHTLSKLPAAAQINSMQLTEILQAAVQSRSVECLRTLFRLPAAEDMSSKQVAAVLLTALQQDSTACAHAILQQFPAFLRMADITSEDVMRLLRGAFRAPLWQHHSLDAAKIVSDVCKVGAASQLSSAELTKLLVAAASLDLQKSAMPDYDVAVSMLCSLELKDRPHLSSDQLFAVLHMAVQHVNERVMHCICLHPLLATQLLRSEQAVQLLNAAVENGSADCLFHVCMLVAGVQLTSDQVMPAVTEAVGKERTACLMQLCRLQAVYDLSGESVAGMMYDSARCGSAGCLKLLCRLPAAERMSSTDVVGCMTAAAQVEDIGSSTECMRYLCALPAAEGMNRTQMLSVLEEAVKSGSAGRVKLLCSLPAAEHLSSTDVVDSVTAAAQVDDVCSSTECMRYLCGVPAAKGMNRTQMLSLLKAAVKSGSAGSVKLLCSLPAAEQLSGADVVDCVTAAAQVVDVRSGTDCMLQLCGLTAAKSLTSTQVTTVLQAAVQRGSAICVKLLCRSRAAEQLSSADVVDCVAAAAQVEDAAGGTDCMLHLCGLTAAKSLNPTQVTIVLEAAVKRGSEACTALLCQLPAAAEVAFAAVAELWWAAEKQGKAGCARPLRSLIDKLRQNQPAGKLSIVVRGRVARPAA